MVTLIWLLWVWNVHEDGTRDQGGGRASVEAWKPKGSAYLSGVDKLLCFVLCYIEV